METYQYKTKSFSGVSFRETMKDIDCYANEPKTCSGWKVAWVDLTNGEDCINVFVVFRLKTKIVTKKT
jgi:hypothetical protein